MKRWWLLHALLLLVLAAGGLLAVVGGTPVQAQGATPQAVPPRGADQAAVLGPTATAPAAGPVLGSAQPSLSLRCLQAASAAGSGAAGAACDGPALRLPASNGRLPLWPLGQPYPRVAVVQGGQPPYRYELLRGEWPAGLEFDARSGMLFSTLLALHRRSEQFTIEFRDSAQPPQTVRQTFRLVRDKPQPPRLAASASRIVPDGDAVDNGSMRVYRLAADDLVVLMAPPAPAAGRGETESLPTGSPATLPSPPPSPSSAAASDTAAEDLRAILTPLVDLEYPTRPLFEAALSASQCRYFLELQKGERARLGAGTARDQPTVACTYRPDGQAHLPESAPATRRAEFAALLPPGKRQEIVLQARRLYELRSLPLPDWKAVPNCRCVAALKEDTIEAFFPPWHGRSPAPQLDFAAMNAINLLGLQFDADGLHGADPKFSDWTARSVPLARAAHRYGTRLNLVLHTADWAPLLRLKPQESELLADRLATGAAAWLNVSSEDTSTLLRPFLLPWSEPQRLFHGVTLFFDAVPPGADGDASVPFKTLLSDTVRRLVQEMRKLDEGPYVLNIVVPDDRMGQPGAFDWEELMRYVENGDVKKEPTLVTSDAASLGWQAFQAWIERKLEPRAERPTVTVRVMVLLREPTTNFKKTLRARIDRAETVTGQRRVNLLASIVPIVFQVDSAVPLPAPSALRGDAADPAEAAPASAPAAPKTRRRTADEFSQLKDDLAYYQWSFGGMGWWAMPEAQPEPADTKVEEMLPGNQAVKLLQINYPEMLQHVGNRPLCAWVCPDRQMFRLAFELLMLASAGMFLLVHEVHAVRRQGLPVQVLPLLLFLLGVLVGFALWTCDPGLHDFREVPVIFGTVMTLVVAGSAWLAFRKRIPVP